MPLKNKTMALIRLRKTPYSGLLSFMQDVFFRNEKQAIKAMGLLKIIYEKKINTKDWRQIIKELFEVEEINHHDEQLIDEACIKYLGFHRENITASKTRLRGKKAYKELIERQDISDELRKTLNKTTKWNSAVTMYYSIINKLKAIGLIEKTNSQYVKSDKFKRRFSQVITLIEGFENETKQS